MLCWIFGVFVDAWAFLLSQQMHGRTHALFIVVHGLLTVVASLLREHGL